MKKNKPLILVVNDDGIDAMGIRFLSKVMEDIGEVYVVAPDSNRSGSSHSMTLHKEICVRNIDEEKTQFTCSGTPVDCVKLAFNKILPQKPDLCVSGINHGSNHSVNGLYSGTLHAAMEATIQGVSSISFSHLSYNDKIDFHPFRKIIKRISEKILCNKLPEGITLNINFPDVSYDQIEGLKVCNQGQGLWEEHFQLTSTSTNQHNYLITGKFKDNKKDICSDSWALANNFISIVPVGLNPTKSNSLDKLKYLENAF